MAVSPEARDVQVASGRAHHLPVEAACATDVGRVRQNNQDSYLLGLEQGLFIVSDGMGGQQAGDIASKAIVAILPGMIERRMVGMSLPRNRVVELTLRETILELSQRLRTQSTGQVGLKGMGATIALVWMQSSEEIAHLAHMGDSRIYLFRQDRLSSLTEDHSIVALLLKREDITLEEALKHPARGRLSRYVGMEGEVYPDVQTVQLEQGDRLLLCTDGLTGLVPDESIAAILLSIPDPEAACRALVDAANAAGGTDNITVLVINWGEMEPLR